MTTIDWPLAATRAGISQTSFRAMGSAVHIVVVGGRPRIITDAERAIARLERTWSRFLRDSELNELNANAGRPMLVSGHLFTALRRAVDAWTLTDGACDATVCAALEGAGYDKSFSLGLDTERPPALALVPGCADIVLNHTQREVMLPEDVRVDLGGIGKGLAADLVVTELFRLGADGALVNVGGDVRVAGTSVGPDGWVVEIEDPFHPDEAGICVALADGAVATSSRLEKRWRRGGRQMHHLVDPRTGAPVETDIVTVTVIAGEGWWAEALAKAVFVLGIDAGAELLEKHGVQGLFVLEDGTSIAAGDWRRILA